MNETLKVIAERYSCRSFTDQVPEDEKLQAIAQAAIQAPSGMNRQNWHVVIVKNKDLLNEMDREGLRFLASLEDQSMYERIMGRGGLLFYNASCMVFIAIKAAVPPGAELIDCGILAQNVSLAATSLGLANVHCGFATVVFAGERGAEFKQKLKLPEGYEPCTSVLVGYAANPGTPHVPNQDKITWIE